MSKTKSITTELFKYKRINYLHTRQFCEIYLRKRTKNPIEDTAVF